MRVIADALKHGHDISVCGACARASGGKWPEGHVATQYEGRCRECDEVKPLTSLSDWSWPRRSGRRLAMRREF